jgi:hypothetical protein
MATLKAIAESLRAALNLSSNPFRIEVLSAAATAIQADHRFHASSPATVLDVTDRLFAFRTTGTARHADDACDVVPRDPLGGIECKYQAFKLSRNKTDPNIRSPLSDATLVVLQ